MLAFAAYEGTIALYLLHRFHWGPEAAAYAFAGLGFISAVVQGGLIRRLVPRFGETRLIVGGLALASCGFAGLAIVSKAPELALTLLLLGVGQGLLSPSVSGLISRITPMSEQGAVFGTVSSTQTLARMISYSVSNILLDQVSTGAPFWTAFGVDLIALTLAVPLVARAGDREPQPAGVTDLPS